LAEEDPREDVPEDRDDRAEARPPDFTSRTSQTTSISLRPPDDRRPVDRRSAWSGLLFDDRDWLPPVRPADLVLLRVVAIKHLHKKLIS
jgi:hypothetical protein